MPIFKPDLSHILLKKDTFLGGELEISSFFRASSEELSTGGGALSSSEAIDHSFGENWERL